MIDFILTKASRTMTHVKTSVPIEPMKQFKEILLFVLKSAIVGLAVAFVVVLWQRQFMVGAGQAHNGGESTPATASDLAGAADGPVSYADAVEKISPSVVSIYATTTLTRRRVIAPELQRFTGLVKLGPSETFTREYLGSGVIVSQDGYLVTNNHVIKNANEIAVALWDNRIYEARVVGTDPDTDLAVLKIEADGLKAAEFADSDKVRPGDVVLAIGNPFGLSQTVTHGIISATGRSGLDVSAIENFIQTDAPVNEGSSGGALINTLGQVVGISTAMLNKHGAQGINFAIPANAAQMILKEIRTHGKVLRGWLGLAMWNPSYQIRGIKKPEKGVLVLGVYEGTPAARAGIRVGDIITAVNGIDVRDDRHYRELIASAKPGENIRLQGMHQNKPFAVDLVTIEQPPVIAENKG
jgi:serine protease DegS/serine protease DegQ